MNASSVYLAIGLTALFLVVITAFFDFGEVDADFDSDVDFDADASGSSLWSWFSFKGLLAGLAAFGLIAWAVSQGGASVVITLSWAFVGAVFFYILVGLLLLPLLTKNQGSDLKLRSSNIGCIGVIVLAIPKAKEGDVQFVNANGITVKSGAVSRNGERISIGTRVLIVDTTDTSVVVDAEALKELEER